MGGVAVPRVEKFKYLGSIAEEILMRILAIILGQGGKNGRKLLEYCVTRRFLPD